MTLRETREKYQITQLEAAASLAVPLRTYRRFEVDNDYGDNYKRFKMIEALVRMYEITEDKGILTLNQIKYLTTELFETKYKGQIEFCFLFGSYAKGLAKDESDVDLYVCSSLTGFAFTGLMEDLRHVLSKRVDVLRPSELKDNINLINEILKTGIRIYSK